MKKSKLLSVLTAGAVIATTAGTYAVWDTLKAETTTQTVEFRKPVTVTVGTELSQLVEKETGLGETPEVTGTASFTVVNPGDKASQIVLKPEIVSSQGVTINEFNFEIYDKEDGNTKLTGTPDAGYTDTSLTSSNYTIKVTPKDSTVYGKDVNLKLTAELKK